MRSFLLLALIALPLSAQTSLDFGVSVGQQSYASSSDDPRYLPGIELLARRGNAGVQLAVEYADLSEESALIVIHSDLVYRWPIGSFALMAGAGPTFVNVGGDREGPSISTWNAALELERRFGRVALFGRVRQFDYELPRFREGDAGPSGPAVYLGLRFGLRGGRP